MPFLYRTWPPLYLKCKYNTNKGKKSGLCKKKYNKNCDIKWHMLSFAGYWVSNKTICPVGPKFKIVYKLLFLKKIKCI